MERQNENYSKSTTKRLQKQKDSAQDDFPILLESELERNATYCIECGKVHRPGACDEHR